MYHANWLERHDPIQERAAEKWEQGLPLGNGKIGAMVWGGTANRPLTVSLDQAEIWDLRTFEPPMDKTWTEYKQLLAQGRDDEFEDFVFDPQKPHLARIPVGRLELKTTNPPLAHRSRLSLLQARCEGSVDTAAGSQSYAIWTTARRQLLIIECEEDAFTPKWKFVCRDGDYTQEDISDSTAYQCFGKHARTITQMVRDWGYPAMEETYRDGITCFRQEIPESGGFAVAAVRQPGCWLISIRWSWESAEKAETMAVDAVQGGVQAGLTALRQEHDAWWAEYYTASYISIPDTRLEGYYYLQTYLLACCTRPEGPHMTLVGPWSDDTNFSPICDNDYHWNNEQQMQVWPVYAGNRVAFGEPMFDMIEANLDVLRETCRKHFKVDGAFLTHSTGPDLHPTYASVDNFELNGLPWVCHHYWKRYLYTMDEEFLKNRAYPIMKLAIAPLLSELQEGRDGYLHLPWTSSPEYHGINETIRWFYKQAPDWHHRFGPDATIDLALTRFLLGTLCKVSQMLNCDADDRVHWQTVLNRLAPYPKDAFGGLAVRADVELTTSHRHLSHMFPIYPLGELNMENDPKTIGLCLDVLGMLGRGEWVGWSFPWAAIMYTRGSRPAAARNILLDYVDRYVTETGIHYQGPQGQCDISLYGNKNGTFGLTIEAQLGVPEAIHELLMRTENGITRIFKDAPPAWAECAFQSLRCEGAFLIDAVRTNYRTSFIRVFSEKGGRIVIDTDFGSGEIYGPVQYADGHYIADMKPGQTILFWRGDRPNAEFTPLEGNPYEYHFWGVKRVRRF